MSDTSNCNENPMLYQLGYERGLADEKQACIDRMQGIIDRLIESEWHAELVRLCEAMLDVPDDIRPGNYEDWVADRIGDIGMHLEKRCQK